MGKTHIEITEERRKQLRVFKAKRGLTYDEAIAELIDGYSDCDECGTGGGGLCPDCKAEVEIHKR